MSLPAARYACLPLAMPAEWPTPRFRVKYIVFAAKKSFLRGAAFHRLLSEMQRAQPARVLWWHLCAIAALVYLASARVGVASMSELEVRLKFFLAYTASN